jgi:hypothetical protein
MQFVKRLFMGVGAVALTAMVLSLTAPKVAHGMVAALVQVVNTTTNPVVNLSADTSTRLPYQSAQTFPWTFSSTLGTQEVPFAQVPAGYRLVTESVSATLVVYSGNPTPNGYICTEFNQTTCFPSFSGIYAGSNSVLGIINQQVTRYIGPGDTPNRVLPGGLWNNYCGAIQHRHADRAPGGLRRGRLPGDCAIAANAYTA